MWFIKKNQSETIEVGDQKKKVISIEEADKLCKNLLMSTQYSDYEDDVPYRNIIGAGESNTPIYTKLCTGVFERYMYGIVVNMEDPQRMGIIKFKKELGQDKMISRLKTEANIVATKPQVSSERQVITSLDPMSGRTIKTETPVFKPLPVPEKEGDLS